jgi:hypothetical protein
VQLFVIVLAKKYLKYLDELWLENGKDSSTSRITSKYKVMKNKAMPSSTQLEIFLSFQTIIYKKNCQIQ